MNKSQLRNIFKEKRNNLSADEVEDKSLSIANLVLKLRIWEKQYYHLFLSIARHREVNTEYLLHILQGKDKNTVVSKSDFSNRTLKHYLLTDSTPIQLNSYGIPEPVEGLEVPVDKLDVVFVPLLACDNNGNRVGYGQGFYDRFLKQCRPDTLKVGLSFFEPVDIIETNANDVSLNVLVTPRSIIKF